MLLFVFPFNQIAMIIDIPSMPPLEYATFLKPKCFLLILKSACGFQITHSLAFPACWRPLPLRTVPAQPPQHIS